MLGAQQRYSTAMLRADHPSMPPPPSSSPPPPVNHRHSFAFPPFTTPPPLTPNTLNHTLNHTLAINPYTLFPLSSPPYPPDAYKGQVCNAGVQGWAEQAARHVEEVATFRAGGLPASVRTIAHCGFTGTVAYSLTGWLVISPCLAHSHCAWPVSATLPACVSMHVCLC